MVCQLHLNENLYVKKTINIIAHLAHHTPTCHINPISRSIDLLFGIPPATTNSQHQTRTEAPLTLLISTSPHFPALSATESWKWGAALVAPSPAGRRDPSARGRGGCPQTRSDKGRGPRPAPRAALPGATPQPTCLSRRRDPLPAHGRTNGWQRGQNKPRSPPQPGWRTPAQASMFPRLCGSGSDSDSGSAPARTASVRRPRGGESRGKLRRTPGVPKAPARSSRRSRGVRRADFWEMKCFRRSAFLHSPALPGQPQSRVAKLRS